MGSSCTKPKDINNGHGGEGDGSKSDVFQSFFKATILLGYLWINGACFFLSIYGFLTSWEIIYCGLYKSS